MKVFLNCFIFESICYAINCSFIFEFDLPNSCSLVSFQQWLKSQVFCVDMECMEAHQVLIFKSSAWFILWLIKNLIFCFCAARPWKWYVSYKFISGIKKFNLLLFCCSNMKVVFSNFYLFPKWHRILRSSFTFELELGISCKIDSIQNQLKLIRFLISYLDFLD
jgi:hypothetical protein